MAQSAPVAAVRFVFRDILGDALRFPAWWYTTGLLIFLGWVGTRARLGWQLFGVGIWSRNILTPMFGQRDIQGRLISFFFRLFQTIVRLVGYFFYMVLLALACAAWIALPLTVTILLVAQIAHMNG